MKVRASLKIKNPENEFMVVRNGRRRIVVRKKKGGSPRAKQRQG